MAFAADTKLKSEEDTAQQQQSATMDFTTAANLLELTEIHKQWKTESAYVCVARSFSDEETILINIVETMEKVARVKWADPIEKEDLHWFPSKFQSYPCVEIITELRLVFKEAGFNIVVDKSEKRNHGKICQVRIACSRFRLSKVR